MISATNFLEYVWHFLNRAQAVSFLISQGVERGNVLNDPEDKKKVIVAINAESDGRIDEIKVELVKFLNKLNEEDPECYSHFPRDISASKLYELANPHAVRILSLSQLSSSLMLEQTSKGVGAMLSLSAVLKPLTSLPAAINALTAKLK